MENREIIPFAVHYQSIMKVVKVTISDLLENIRDEHESCPGFPQ